MRLLEMSSAGLSLISVAVILTVLVGQNDKPFLFLAAICCSLVAVYQMVNFYLGYQLKPKVTKEKAEKRDAIDAKAEGEVRMLGEALDTYSHCLPTMQKSATERLEKLLRK
jgi:hypothetical protein